MVTAAMMFAPWKKSYDQPRQHIKKQGHYFAKKGPSSQSYGFSSSHVWMWKLDYEESWALKNWCSWPWYWRRLLRVPWIARRSNHSLLRELSTECFIGRTDVEAETPILLPAYAKNWLSGKDPDAWKDCRWEEKGMTEDKMVGCYHWLNGHEFE